MTPGFTATPGSWATIDRAWNSGDQWKSAFRLSMHMQAVDKQHPERVAVVRGPVAIVMEGLWQENRFQLPKPTPNSRRCSPPVRSPAISGPHSARRHAAFPFLPVLHQVPLHAFYMYLTSDPCPSSNGRFLSRRSDAYARESYLTNKLERFKKICSRMKSSNLGSATVPVAGFASRQNHCFKSAATLFKMLSSSPKERMTRSGRTFGSLLSRHVQRFISTKKQT